MRDVGEVEVHIAHLDMDCFFAAVELLDHPELSGRPLVVGGATDRGVVVSASYEARAFGVRAAMPSARARQLCPHAAFLSPRHDRYRQLNRQLLDIVKEMTPTFEPVAFDEAFIDLSLAHRLFGTSTTIAHWLRDEVYAKLGLPCSLGVGRTKLISKLASRAAKPSSYLSDSSPPIPVITVGAGVVIVRPGDEHAFLDRHVVRDLPGVGPKAAERLRAVGVRSVVDARTIGRDRLRALVGRHAGDLIADAVVGNDPRVVRANHDVRSIGHEETFDRDLYVVDELVHELRRFAIVVARRQQERGLCGRSLTLKVKFRDHSVVSRSVTIVTSFESATSISDEAERLLRKITTEAGVRLLGLHLSHFEAREAERNTQLDLFDRSDADLAAAQRAEIGRVMDRVRDKYGEGSLLPLSARRYRPRDPRRPPVKGIDERTE